MALRKYRVIGECFNDVVSATSVEVVDGCLVLHCDDALVVALAAGQWQFCVTAEPEEHRGPIAAETLTVGSKSIRTEYAPYYKSEVFSKPTG